VTKKKYKATVMISVIIDAHNTAEAYDLLALDSVFVMPLRGGEVVGEVVTPHIIDVVEQDER
jgi:hypothetical protein